MASPACDRALGTTEIHELIMLNLPFRDLFVVQRVATCWRNRITASVAIQKAMFLSSSAGAQRPLTHAQSALASDDEENKKELLYSSPVKFNPHLPVLGCGSARLTANLDALESMASSGAMAVVSVFVDFPDPAIFATLTLFERPETDEKASWRRTFITQPPIKAMEMYHASTQELWEEKYGESDVAPELKYKTLTLWNPNGLTLGDLDDVWKKFVADSAADPDFMRTYGMPPFPESAVWYFRILNPAGNARCEGKEDYGCECAIRLRGY